MNKTRVKSKEETGMDRAIRRDINGTALTLPIVIAAVLVGLTILGFN